MTHYAIANDFSGSNFRLSAADLIDDEFRDVAALRLLGVQLIEIPAGKEQLAAEVLSSQKTLRSGLGSEAQLSVFSALVATGVITLGGGGGGGSIGPQGTLQSSDGAGGFSDGLWESSASTLQFTGSSGVTVAGANDQDIALNATGTGSANLVSISGAASVLGTTGVSMISTFGSATIVANTGVNIQSPAGNLALGGTSGVSIDAGGGADNWPSTQGPGALTSDGSGTLTWQPVSSGGTLQNSFDASDTAGAAPTVDLTGATTAFSVGVGSGLPSFSITPTGAFFSSPPVDEAFSVTTQGTLGGISLFALQSSLIFTGGAGATLASGQPGSNVSLNPSSTGSLVTTLSGTGSSFQVDGEAAGGSGVSIQQMDQVTINGNTGSTALLSMTGYSSAVVNAQDILNFGSNGAINIAANHSNAASTVNISALNADPGAENTLFLAGDLLSIFAEGSVGADGQVLTSNGTNANWKSPAITSIEPTVRVASFAAADPGLGQLITKVDTGSGAFTVTLPASPTTNAKLTYKDVGGAASSNALTIDGNGNNVEGSASVDLTTNNGSITLIFDGSEWWSY